MVDGPEPQLVHHRDRPGAHGDDVAHDPADAGRRTLERFDERRMVVRLHLEGDRPAVPDVQHAGVLAHADDQVLAHLLGGLACRTGAGSSCSTCRSSARSTSPSTWPARRWWAAGPGSRGSARIRRSVRPSAAYGCSRSGVAIAFATESTTWTAEVGVLTGLGSWIEGVPDASILPAPSAPPPPRRSGRPPRDRLRTSSGQLAALDGIDDPGFGFGRDRGRRRTPRCAASSRAARGPRPVC